MNCFRVFFLLFFAISFTVRTMEVGKSEDVFSMWNTLPHEEQHEHFPSQVVPRDRNSILRKLINVKEETKIYEFGQTKGLKKIKIKDKVFNFRRKITDVLESKKYIAVIYSKEDYKKEVRIIDSQNGKEVRQFSLNYWGAYTSSMNNRSRCALTDRYFIICYLKKDEAGFDFFCIDLKTGKEKKIELARSFIAYFPINETSFAWIEVDSEGKTHVFYYDIDRDKLEEFFSSTCFKNEDNPKCSQFFELGVSGDWERIAFGQLHQGTSSTRAPGYGIRIYIFGKTSNGKWGEIIDFILDMPPESCLRFDNLNPDKLIVTRRFNFDRKPQQTICDLTSAIKVNRHLFRNPACFLPSDERNYSCKLSRKGKKCGCITHGKENKKIRLIDMLHQSLINYILQHKVLSYENYHLFEYLPKSVRDILGVSESDLNTYKKRQVEELEEKEFRAKIARQGNFTSPRLCLPSNVDLENKDIEEEASLDDLVQEIEESMPQESNGKEKK